MIKIGHRGAKGYVAENTLASFQKAIDLKIDGVELDVHLSLDNEIMVVHDETVNRTTIGNGFVKNLTCKALQSFGIPKLSEVLDLIDNKMLVNIELKCDNIANKVALLLQYYSSEKRWNTENFIVSSFNWKSLQLLNTFDKSIKIGVLTEDNIENALAFAEEIKAFSIHPYYKLLNAENVALIKNRGFEVHTWTVNSTEDLIFVKNLKVNAIISDFPDRI